MKKLFSFLLLSALVFSLVACGGGAGQESGSDGDPSVSADTSADSCTAEKLSGFALGHSLYTKAVADMKAAVGDNIEANNKVLEDADPDNYIKNGDYLNVYYSPFSSYRLLLLADLGSEEGIEIVKRAYGLYGYKEVSVSKTDKGYSLTYKRGKDDTLQECTDEISCRDDGSFFMTCRTQGFEEYFIDFVVLGGGKYALQTQTERAIIEYKDGVLAKVLHSETINDYDSSTDMPFDYSLFYSSADSIYENTDITDAWVTEADSQGKLRYLFNYTPAVLTVSGRKAVYNWDTDSYDYGSEFTVTISLGE